MFNFKETIIDIKTYEWSTNKWKMQSKKNGNLKKTVKENKQKKLSWRRMPKNQMQMCAHYD